MASARDAFNQAQAAAEGLREKAEAAEATVTGTIDPDTGELAAPPHEPRAAYNAAVEKAEGLRAAADAESYDDAAAAPVETVAAPQAAEETFAE